MISKPLAVFICGVLNPIFSVLILEEVLLAPSLNRWLHTIIFWGKTLLALGSAVGLAELSKAKEFWPGHPFFPSGHTTFAVSAATCLILQRGKRWAWLTVPMAFMMMFYLVVGKFHTWDEVAGGTILGISFPIMVWKLFPSQPISPTTGDLIDSVE